MSEKEKGKTPEQARSVDTVSCSERCVGEAIGGSCMSTAE